MGQDFRELFFIVLFLAFVFAGVQWLLLRFSHWSIALGTTFLIAFFIASVYVSLKHASPNGSSNGPNGSEFIIPTLLVFPVMFCGFCGVAYLSKIQLPKFAYVLPLGLVAVCVVGRFMYQYVENVTLYAQLFSSCKIELLDKSGNEPMVREISFSSSFSGLSTPLELNASTPPYPRITRWADRIVFRCHSPKNDRMFFQDFPFDYSVFKEKEGQPWGLCFWVREKIVLPLKIVVLPDEQIDLYVGGSLIKRYQLQDEDSIEKVKQKGKKAL